MRQLRTLLRQPTYVVMTLAILGLTVGVNLVVFTMVNALWLKRPSFPNAARTVVVLNGDNNAGSRDSRLFTSLDLPTRSGAFVTVAGQVSTSGPTAEEATPRLQFRRVGVDVETLGVTASYFDALGLAIRGRGFTENEERAGAEAVAVISDRLWTRYFDRRPDIIGAVAETTSIAVRIIGVAPAGFEGARLGEHTDVWIPRGLVNKFAVNSNPAPALLALGHLRPGVSVDDAERLVAGAAQGREREFRHVLVPVGDVFGAPNSKTLVIRERGAAGLVGALSALVLLAGAATLMALVLVHYERRRQELSVRLALGASRARLTAQLAGELAWLVGSGCGVAVLIAIGGLRALPTVNLPGGVDVARLDLSMDWRVVTGAILLSAATAGFAALLPLLRFTRADLARHLVATTGGATLASQRIRRVLLGLNVATTVVVLMSAALFVRAVQAGFSGGAGFDVDRTVFLQVQLNPMSGAVPGSGAEMVARFGETARALSSDFASLSGVTGVSKGRAPIGPEPSQLIRRQTVVTTGGERELSVAPIQVGPDYLATLGVPLVLGRPLTDTDGAVLKPMIVTASLARALWPGKTPIGETLALPAGRFSGTIVGVAADFRYGSLTGDPPGVVVVPSALWGVVVDLVVRADRPDALIEPLRRRVAVLVPTAARIDITTGRQLVSRELGRQRLGAWFFSGFGLVALVLAVGGVFGLVAYLAEARRREFGVRLALGATVAQLMRTAMSVVLVPVLLGATCGLALAALAARVTSAFLVGVSPLDPLSYGGVGTLMISSAALAGFFASWRLRRISPSQALRSE